MTTYAAVARPDPERGWLIRIPGLGSYPEDGLPTWARNLAEVEPVARDLIAVYLDVPLDSFAVEVQVELPESVRHHLELAGKYADEAAHAQAAAAAQRRRAARELKAAGLTVRDIGAALGVSHQRAQQLVSA
jgi:hypothetical protein